MQWWRDVTSGFRGGSTEIQGVSDFERAQNNKFH